MELLLYAPCVILLVCSLYLFRRFVDTRCNLPPGPRPLPLVGNLLELGAQPHRSLACLAERHGLLTTPHLGAVAASSPNAARDILQRLDATFSMCFAPDIVWACGHDRFSMPRLPPSSPQWRALRKVCSAELFVPRRLDEQRTLRHEKARRLVSHVASMAREGAVVDVRRVVFTTLLNMLSCTLFSVDLVDLDDGRAGSAGENADTIAEFASTVGVPNVLDYFPAVTSLDPQRLRRRLSRVFTWLFAKFDEQIERRMRPCATGKPPKNDFLDVLLDHRTTEDSRSFDRQTLWSFAGSDTSVVTVEWAMAELLQSPPSMAKAREELARVIGSKPEVEETDIDRLEHLHAVVKETFRLHPPAPLLLPHRAEIATEIGGYTVPKGATVLVNIWAIDRDSNVWFEPDKFMPEKFLQGEVDFRGRHFGLIPFGSGRRICPGLSLAVRMVHLMLASLLDQFEWRLPPEVEKNAVDMAEKFGIVMSLSTPLQAIATPIQ